MLDHFHQQHPASAIIEQFTDLEAANQEISGADWTVVLENAPDGEYAFEIEDIETGDISYSPVFDLGDGEGEEDNANRSSAPPSSTTTSSGGASNTDPTSSEGGNTRDGGTTSPPATSATGTQETGSPGSSSSDSGLSTGAKAGIGVGAGLGGILIVLLVAWLFYRRRKARSAGGNNAGAIEAAQTRQERVVGQPVSTAELTGNPISELPADDYGSYAKLSELPSPESSPGTRSDNGGQNGGFVARSELQ